VGFGISDIELSDYFNTSLKKVKVREAGVYSALQLEEADCTLTH
jgi:hypothetical protein